MKLAFATLAALVVLTTTGVAHAVPQTIGFSGRLLFSDTDEPVDEQVTLEFRIYDDPSATEAGSLMWTESHLVEVEAGLAFASLGGQNHVNVDEVVGGGDRWLEVVVTTTDGTIDVLSPRLQLQAVPFALRADTAETALSLAGFDPSQALTPASVSGSNGVTAAPGGTPGTVQLALDSSVQRRTAGNLSCSGAGVFIRSIAADGTATCAADANNVYAAAPSSGLTLSANTFNTDTTIQRRTATDLACPAGQFIRAISQNGTTVCGAVGMSCRRETVLNSSTATCNSDEFRTGGGCSLPSPGAALNESAPHPSDVRAWRCRLATSLPASQIDTHVICCRLTL